MVDGFRNLCLQAFLVGAEELPDVRVGERVVFVLRFFEASAGIGAEVLGFHLLQAAGNLFIALVFQHFLHQLLAVFVVGFHEFGVAFFGGEQFLHLEGHQAARHAQKVACLGKVHARIGFDPFRKVVRNFGDRNLVQCHFFFLHQIDEQIHRTVERSNVDFVIFLFLDFGHLS